MAALAIDIGGTKLAVGVVDRAGCLLWHDRTPTAGRDADDLFDRLAALVTAGLDTTPVEVVGVGCGGPMAPGGAYRIDAINITSDDSAAQVVDIFLRAGSTNFLLGSVSIPAGAGKTGTLPKEFFLDGMPSSEQGMNMSGSELLQAAMEGTITSAKTVTLTIFGGLY